MRYTSNEKPFKGIVLFNNDIIKLEKIYVTFSRGVTKSRTHDGTLREPNDDQQFNIMNPNKENMEKLLKSEFTIELDDGTKLCGCKFGEHEKVDSDQMIGFFTNVIY